MFAAEQGQQGAGAQLIVIVEIFIVRRQPVDALGDQLGHAVFDLGALAVIAEAGGELPHDAAALFDLAPEPGRRALELGRRPGPGKAPSAP